MSIMIIVVATLLYHIAELNHISSFWEIYLLLGPSIARSSIQVSFAIKVEDVRFQVFGWCIELFLRCVLLPFSA